MLKWQPPPMHQFKVNVDAVTKPEKGTIRVVIRNHNSEIMASLAQPLAPIVPTQTIESQAIIQGFVLATHIGLSEFMLLGRGATGQQETSRPLSDGTFGDSD